MLNKRLTLALIPLILSASAAADASVIRETVTPLTPGAFPVMTVYEVPRHTANRLITPDQVITVPAAKGIATLIEFPADEPIQDFASGFSSAWEIASRGTRLFLKPKEKRPATNLVVTTAKGSYLFELRSVKAAQALYRITLHRPAKPVSRKESEARAEKELIQKLARQSVTPEIHSASESADAPQSSAAQSVWTMNFGEDSDSKRIAPVAVSDDGRFTSIRFRPGLDFPAVFAVNSDGESIVDTHVDTAGTLVLHGVYPELRLRLGKAVVGLYREAGPTLKDSAAGTSLPGLKRTLKSKAASLSPIPHKTTDSGAE